MQQQVYFTGVQGWADSILGILSLLIPAAFALAVLAFFWGVAVYIFRAGDPKSAEQGRSIMIGGLIGLFVISAVWGIVFFIGKNVLGTNGAIIQEQTVPTIKPFAN